MSTVINTPSSNIGRVATNLLLDAGEQVTIISRNPDKVADLVARGARLVEGSLDDRATLEKAFKGADRLFWLTPPNPRPDFLDWAVGAARQAAEVAVASGIDQVVVLSSIGAHSGPGTGPIYVLSLVEQVWNGAVDHVLSLRPGFFMENFMNDLATIGSQGVIYSPASGNVKTPMVATRDIGAVVAEVLTDTSWQGHLTRGVHGPVNLTFAEAAAQIGEGLGKPVNLVEITIDQFRGAMAQYGAPDFVVNLYAELYEGFRRGLLSPAEPRTAETTTPTTMVQFTRDVLAPALQAG